MSILPQIRKVKKQDSFKIQETYLCLKVIKCYKIMSEKNFTLYLYN